ncbi:MAG: amino acid ABC transporter permease [Spartobacteria bacterium]|nr:amino acid ABC transporter permease [Spartobacteria bacterium]
MGLLSEYIHHIWTVLPNLLEGALLTVEVTALSVFFGIFLGLLVSLGKLSPRKWLNIPATIYIDVVRGTPLLVQILIVYFGFPGFLSAVFDDPIRINALVAGVIACSLNSGAYVAEIFRAGIQSIHRGQYEAATSLGLTKAQVMIHVILPQAFRRIIPPMGNEFIVLLKDSSLLSIIGVNELLRQGQLYAARTFASFPTYIGIALVYLVMTMSISRLLALLERRMGICDRRS